ncbi:hypothetical protein Hdeb2414_s0008g00269891 [Helianthus debilis subsp. tardiflorus]
MFFGVTFLSIKKIRNAQKEKEKLTVTVFVCNLINITKSSNPNSNKSDLCLIR